MKNKNNTTKSIFRRLLVPMLIVMVLQSLIFIIFLNVFGTVNKLNDNAFYIFKEKANSRKKVLEDYLTIECANHNNFTSFIEQFLKERMFSSYENQITINNVKSLISLLRSSNATGAFIILDDKKNLDGNFQSFYIRDYNPINNSLSNKDIFVEYGSSILVKNTGLSMDEHWADKIFMLRDDEKYNFFNKPIEATKNSSINNEDLGYWSKPFKLHNSNVEVITYSLPIRNNSGYVYGVVGIEITLNYLKSMLPYKEICGEDGGYFISVTNDGKSFTDVVKNAPRYMDIDNNENKFELISANNSRELYYLDNSSYLNTIDKIIAVTYPMKLYHTISPFGEDIWCLNAVIPQSLLYIEANRLKNILVISFILSISIGCISAIAISTYFSKPIKDLALRLKSSTVDKPVILPKIKISEIDDLSSSLEKFSRDVEKYSSRLTSTFQLVDFSLGIIEYDKISQQIWCTSKVPCLLAFPKEYRNKQDFSVKEFMSLLNSSLEKTKHLNKRVYDFNSDTVLAIIENNYLRWIKFKIIDQEDKKLFLVMEVTDEIQEKLKIEYERDYDILTNLYNRRKFKLVVEEKLASNDCKICAMVMWDLDNLKYINDTYGHDLGDKYIIQAAQVLSTIVQYRAFVARRSGDEFFAFLYGYDSKLELLNLIQRIHRNLYNTEFKLTESIKTKLRASAGIAWYPQDSMQYDELTKYADFAMYYAKETIKGSIKEFNLQLYRRDELLIKGKEELNLLFEKQLVKFAFQPIVSTVTGEVFAYEALMRPQSENIKTVYDVMRLAKAQSKLYQLEFLTWSGTFRDFSKQKNIPKEIRLFINSVPNTCLSNENLKFIKEQYGDYYDRVVVEIIETEQIDSEYMDKKKDIAKKLNMEIALDDFGAGYNSETVLLVVNPKYVKLDISLIRNINKDTQKQQLVSSMISYIKTRQIQIIVEGIETKEELETIISFGVDYIQGYYIARPNFDIKGIPEDKKNEILKIREILKKQ